MNLEIFPHEHFMKLAFDQAIAASQIDEVPVGAVIVKGQRIIGAAHNLCEQLRDPTAGPGIQPARTGRQRGDLTPEWG